MFNNPMETDIKTLFNENNGTLNYIVWCKDSTLVNNLHEQKHIPKGNMEQKFV